MIARRRSGAEVVMMIRTLGGYLRPSRRIASLAIVASLLGCTLAAARDGSAVTRGGRTFIVSCDCSTAKTRNSIAAAVRHHGGKILYRYEAFPGFAVTVPGTIDSTMFVRAIRRIPAVTDIRESGHVELQ